MSLSTTVQPLHSRFANRFGPSISETTRPNPRTRPRRKRGTPRWPSGPGGGPFSAVHDAGLAALRCDILQCSELLRAALSCAKRPRPAPAAPASSGRWSCWRGATPRSRGATNRASPVRPDAGRTASLSHPVRDYTDISATLLPPLSSSSSPPRAVASKPQCDGACV